VAANASDEQWVTAGLGVGVGWARQEFQRTRSSVPAAWDADRRSLQAVRTAWDNDEDYRSGRIPIWVGGNSDAGLRRAVRLGEAWHPLRFTLAWLREALAG